MDCEVFFVLKIVLLVVFFMRCEHLSENKFLQFFLNLIPFAFSFIYKYSKLYFKIISSIFVIFKTLFFLPILPLFFQYSLSIYFSFDYLWTIYLLSTIYSFFIICVPLYIYKFCTCQISNNFFSVYKFKLCIIFFILFYFSEQSSLSIISLLISYEIYNVRKLYW